MPAHHSTRRHGRARGAFCSPRPLAPCQHHTHTHLLGPAAHEDAHRGQREEGRGRVGQEAKKKTGVAHKCASTPVCRRTGAVCGGVCLKSTHTTGNGASAHAQTSRGEKCLWCGNPTWVGVLVAQGGRAPCTEGEGGNRGVKIKQQSKWRLCVKSSSVFFVVERRAHTHLEREEKSGGGEGAKKRKGNEEKNRHHHTIKPPSCQPQGWRMRPPSTLPARWPRPPRCPG